MVHFMNQDVPVDIQSLYGELVALKSAVAELQSRANTVNQFVTDLGQRSEDQAREISVLRDELHAIETKPDPAVTLGERLDEQGERIAHLEDLAEGREPVGTLHSYWGSTGEVGRSIPIRPATAYDATVWPSTGNMTLGTASFSDGATGHATLGTTLGEDDPA